MTTQPTEEMESKHFYESRIIWVNIIAVVALIISAIAGRDILTPELQASITTIILAVVNIILRLRTNQSVVK